MAASSAARRGWVAAAMASGSSRTSTWGTRWSLDSHLCLEKGIFLLCSPCLAGQLRITYNRMVVLEPLNESVDDLFHALADATRRDILRRSVHGELSVSRLAE